MHEFSIAMSILNIVKSTCEDRGISRVDKIRVQVGKASGVMADSLVFAFDCAKEASVAAEACLEIDEVAVGGHCGECASTFTVDEPYVFHCPECGGTAFQITSGSELQIVELEVDG